MGRKNKGEFPMTPALKQFQFELASEIGITGLGEKTTPVKQTEPTGKLKK